MKYKLDEAYACDIETNGFMAHQVRPGEKHLDKVHMIGLKNLQTGEYRQYCDSLANCEPIADFLEIYPQIPLLVGHNFVKFDAPVIEQIYGVKFEGQLLDTMLLSKFFHGDIARVDYANINSGNPMPKELAGWHSLEAWGWRLGERKLEMESADADENSGESVWDVATEDMLVYMEQDVNLTGLLFEFFKDKIPGQEVALEWEHRFAYWMHVQQMLGTYFDTDAAKELEKELLEKKEKCTEQICKMFKPLVEYKGMTVPKRANKNRGILPGIEYSRIKIHEEFIPTKDNIARALMEQKGWKPEVFSESQVYKHNGESKPSLTDEIMGELTLEGAEPIKELAMVNKRLGMLANGTNAWLKLVKDNKIHGSVDSLGARSHRCTHARPNLGQVTGSGKEYGEEMRKLFCAPEGWHYVNVDLSGIELRVFSHFLCPYDDGIYKDTVLNSDIHVHNQQAAGLATRSLAKLFIYKTLYGAGPPEIGKTLSPELPPKEREKIGAAAQERFKSGVKGYKKLDRSIVKELKDNKGRVELWDGRLVPVDSQHKRLNCKLQGSASIYAKYWALIVYEELVRLYGEPGYDKNWVPVAHVHDEISIITRTKEMAESLEKICKEAVEKSDKFFNVDCPNDIGFAMGNDWSVH